MRPSHGQIRGKSWQTLRIFLTHPIVNVSRERNPLYASEPESFSKTHELLLRSVENVERDLHDLQDRTILSPASGREGGGGGWGDHACALAEAPPPTATSHDGDFRLHLNESWQRGGTYITLPWQLGVCLG